MIHPLPSQFTYFCTQLHDTWQEGDTFLLKYKFNKVTDYILSLELKEIYSGIDTVRTIWSPDR